MLHRESLEGIHVENYRYLNNCRINTESFREHTRNFPRLVQWSGCDRATLSEFLGGYYDDSESDDDFGCEVGKYL